MKTIALWLPILVLSAISPSGKAEIPPAIRSRSGFSGLKEKLEKEKKATIAFLGGSITQNGSGHVTMVPDWLRERFPEAEIEVINAGLSSTCSVSGAFRLERDVLGRGPIDLLVVEFAVNDDQDAAHDRSTAIRGLEGIVRRFRKANPAAAIVSVHFVNPEMLDTVRKGGAPVSIEAHEAVDEHYGVTSVNIAAALARAVEQGEMTWEDYGGVHPKPEGYRFASDRIVEAIQAGWDTPGFGDLPAPLDAHSYDGAAWVDPQSVSSLGGWRFAKVGPEIMPVGSIRKDYLGMPLLRGESPGDHLYFDFQGRMVGAFVLAGPDAGAVEVSIDGGDWKRVELFHKHSKGLNYPRSVIFADDLEPRFHQMALRIAETRHAESQGHTVNILGFEVNR